MTLNYKFNGSKGIFMSLCVYVSEYVCVCVLYACVHVEECVYMCVCVHERGGLQRCNFRFLTLSFSTSYFETESPTKAELH